MKKFTLFMTMFIAFAMTAFAQVDYTPTNVTATNKTRNDRNLTSVKVGTETYTLSTTELTYCYVDKYEDVVFTVEAGQEVALDITTNGSWTHGSVYVDFDNNGFTAGVTENWKPTGDLVAYAFYNNDSSSDASGWNSVGTVVSGDNRNRPAIPSYTIPAETPVGEYRIRFKLDWCNIDPNGDADGKFGDFMENGGQIVDAKLVVNAAVAPEPEPELPALEITGYTPTEAVEKLETITITFNDEIAGEQDLMSMNPVYVGSQRNAANWVVEGNTITITLWSPITTPGEYGLVIPKGHITRKANGEDIILDKEIVFTVKEAIKPLEIVSYTPAEAVESLKEITVTFNDEIAGEQDLMSMNPVYVGSQRNAANWVVEGNTITITLWSPITTPGEYGLVIPKGHITRKANGEDIILDKEIVFTVKEAVVEPEIPTVDGQIVGLNNIPTEVTNPADIKTGYYLLKQANEAATSSGDLGYIKADYENVNSAVSIATKAPTAGANNEATYVWFVEKADDGSITIATANKKAFWQAPWQGQKNLAAEPSSLGIVTESVTLGGKTATPTEGTAIISNNNPDNLSLVHYSGGKLGSWNDANPASVWFVEFIEVNIEDLNVLSEVDVTYNYTYNGETVKTETFTVAKGTAMPAVTLPYGVTTQTVLPETATEDGTYEIVCEFDLAQLPFAPAASYGEIEKWYYMTIHATTPDYLYYAEGQEYIPLNVETLPEENLDAYTWAFVGNPFTGYQIVNKLAGEGMILSSSNPYGNDGNTFPVLVDATAVPAGNNSHWDISTSTFAENGFFIAQHGTTYRMNNRDNKLAYWTGGADHGSTFLVTEREMTLPEVTPLLVVAVTPNEAVETLQEITIEFDAEIAIDQANINACTIDYGWGVIIGTTASVEGNVLKLVAHSPIKDKGQYPLTIPAGVVTRVSDGVAYEGGTFTFEVKEKAVEPLTVVKVTPAAEVRTLDVITIEFSHNVFVNAMGTAVATISNADNSVKVTISPMDIQYEGNVVTFNLGENAITVAGEYTLDIPSGIIARSNDGVKYSGTHKFTVVAPKTFAVEAYLFPTPQGEVTEIKSIRVEANQGQSLAELPTGWTFTNEAGEEYEMRIEWMYDYESIFIAFNPAITEAGTYTLTIPAGSLKTDDGKECEAATFQFTVVVPVGIEGVEADAEQTIYDLTGRKIETITKGGIYIVNGKKVIVK